MTTRTRDFSSAASQGAITFTIDGEEFSGIPAVPANAFGAFMELTSQIAKVGSRLNNDTEENRDNFNASMQEFIRLSLDGMEMVLQQESIDRIRGKVDSRENPIDVETLVEVFSWLAEMYSTRRKAGQVEGTTDDPFTDDDSVSDTGSENTGGSSEDNSSAEEPTSTAGNPTT